MSRRGSSLGVFWDLGSVTVVVPGARAGRGLTQRLLNWADQQGWGILPPEVTTAGRLPERLYRRKRPFASQLVQQLAWAEALRGSEPSTLREIWRDPPEADDDPRWMELGVLLWRQHRELAADGHGFGRVVELGRQLPEFRDLRRWQVLAGIQQRYLDRLDALGLWDRQTARRVALEQRECQTDRDLILLGMVDMSVAVRGMLDQVQQRVTSLIFAPGDWADGFDHHGCVRAAAWRRAEIPIQTDQLVQVDGPQDQARAVAAEVAGLADQFGPAQISVGVPDDTQVPMVLRELRDAGARARYGPGHLIEATRPVRLVRAVASYLATPTYASLGDLLRHPDSHRGLAQSRQGRTETDRRDSAAADVAEQIDCVDRYLRSHLPDVVDSAEVRSQSQAVAEIVQRVQQWLEPLQGAPRRAADWVEGWLTWLTSTYGGGTDTWNLEQTFDRAVVAGCEAFRDGMLELQRLPHQLDPPVTAWQAALMALSTLRHRLVPADPPEGDELELLGWLELPLDDAPALVVTHLNEDWIPTSASSDLFLPDRLRTLLGLDDNARRYARDAYALTVLTRTRKHLRLIFARRDQEGNPLLPSRLLFASDSDQRVSRALTFFGDAPRTQNTREPVTSESSSSASPKIAVPAPVATSDGHLDGPPTVWRVTDFKRFLACPYRFYLAQRLRLRPTVEPPGELDGAAFGNRMHEVLEQFGNSEVAGSADAESLSAWLIDAARRRFREHYGPSPRPVIELQRLQLERRLTAFAKQQAAWRRAGWQIYLTESQLVGDQPVEAPAGDERTEIQGRTAGHHGSRSGSVEALWKVDGHPIRLRGRIDRVDVHPEHGYAILDYKSSDSGQRPEEVHHLGRKPRSADDWIDLQLPLYRHLAKTLELPPEIQLGYVTLPRVEEDGGFKLARWSGAELNFADEAAARVVRRARENRFWPPAPASPLFDAAFDRICQTDVFDAELPAESPQPSERDATVGINARGRPRGESPR